MLCSSVLVQKIIVFICHGGPALLYSCHVQLVTTMSVNVTFFFGGDILFMYLPRYRCRILQLNVANSDPVIIL